MDNLAREAFQSGQALLRKVRIAKSKASDSWCKLAGARQSGENTGPARARGRVGGLSGPGRCQPADCPPTRPCGATRTGLDGRDDRGPGSIAPGVRRSPVQKGSTSSADLSPGCDVPARCVPRWPMRASRSHGVVRIRPSTFGEATPNGARIPGRVAPSAPVKPHLLSLRGDHLLHRFFVVPLWTRAVPCFRCSQRGAEVELAEGPSPTESGAGVAADPMRARMRAEGGARVAARRKARQRAARERASTGAGEDPRPRIASPTPRGRAAPAAAGADASKAAQIEAELEALKRKRGRSHGWSPPSRRSCHRPCLRPHPRF